MNSKTQQRFKNKWHNIFTEEINKIALSSNDDKRMQSIDSKQYTKTMQTWLTLIMLQKKT